MIEKNKWTKILFHKVLSFTLEWVRTHPHKYTVVQKTELTSIPFTRLYLRLTIEFLVNFETEKD